MQSGRIKAAPFIILGAVFLVYFTSDVILRQFVLYRAAGQSINPNTILDKLPAGIRDEVRQRILIGELKDKLLAATTDGEKISASIALAGATSDKDLQEKYAEIIDKYPSAPESAPAFINYLMAPDTALKSISIPRYHEYMKQLHDPELFYTFDGGLGALKSRKVSSRELLAFLLPLLELKAGYREYQRLYVELSELAFQEGNQDVELKARKLEEACGKLSFYDKVLAAQQAAKKTKK
jgi:hypothetical protein